MGRNWRCSSRCFAGWLGVWGAGQGLVSCRMLEGSDRGDGAECCPLFPATQKGVKALDSGSVFQKNFFIKRAMLLY